MGSLYFLTCTACDYSEEIHEGGGMSGAVYEPMQCRACRRVVAVETRPPDPNWIERAGFEESVELSRCPHCAGDQLERWGTFGGEYAPVAGQCPRCHAAIELHDIGIWD